LLHTSHHAIVLAQLLSFFLRRARPHRALPSFPTRRSSDLVSLARPRSGRFLRSEALRPWSAARIWWSFFAVGFFSSSRRTARRRDRKSTRLNSSHVAISYAVFCLKKKKKASSTRFVSPTAQ